MKNRRIFKSKPVNGESVQGANYAYIFLLQKMEKNFLPAISPTIGNDEVIIQYRRDVKGEARVMNEYLVCSCRSFIS